MIPHTIHAILTNEVALNRAVLWGDEERFRTAAADGASAWGVGVVQDGRALLKRRPRLGNHVFDFATLVGDSPSRFIVGVVLADDGRNRGTDSVPPFRFHNWILGTCPTAGDGMGKALRERVRALIPDHVARTIEGESDADLLMHALVSGIGGNATHRNADFPVELAADLVRDAAEELRSATGGEAPLDAIIGNGRVLVALADRRPLFFRVVEGLDDDPLEIERRRSMHLGPRPTPRPHFRALALTSVESRSPEWTRLDPGSLLAYEPGAGAEVAPLAR